MHTHTHTHTQIDPETLATLVAQYSTTAKGKAGRGAAKNTTTAPSEPPKAMQNASQEPPPLILYVSSDESSPNSSSSDSNDSDDENGTCVNPKGRQASKRKQVALPSGSKTGTSSKGGESDTKNSTCAAKDSKGSGDVPPGWTGAEVTYFNLLHPIFGHNYCAIAELLRTKKCQEVFDYSQKVAADLLLGQGGWPRRFSGKKKKKNMRLGGGRRERSGRRIICI